MNTTTMFMLCTLAMAAGCKGADPPREAGQATAQGPADQPGGDAPALSAVAPTTSAPAAAPVSLDDAATKMRALSEKLDAIQSRFRPTSRPADSPTTSPANAETPAGQAPVSSTNGAPNDVLWVTATPLTNESQLPGGEQGPGGWPGTIQRGLDGRRDTRTWAGTPPPMRSGLGNTADGFGPALRPVQTAVPPAAACPVRRSGSGGGGVRILRATSAQPPIYSRRYTVPIAPLVSPRPVRRVYLKDQHSVSTPAGVVKLKDDDEGDGIEIDWEGEHLKIVLFERVELVGVNGMAVLTCEAKDLPGDHVVLVIEELVNRQGLARNAGGPRRSGSRTGPDR